MIPYFIHEPCGGQLYLVLDNIMIISTYGIASRNLRVGMAQLLQASENCFPKFFCSSCNEIISSGVSGFCSMCRKIISVSNLYRVSKSEEIGGIYCIDCIKDSDELKDASKNCIGTIIQKSVDTRSII